MADGNLRRWIGDHAQSLFGMSDRTVVDFMTVTARGAKSPDQLYSNLSALGLPDTTAAHTFAAELFRRAVPSSSSRMDVASSEKPAGPSSSKRYALLLDEQGNEELEIRPERRKKKRRSATDEASSKRTDESSSKRARMTEDEEKTAAPNADTDPELARLRDIAERDEFAARMRERDKEGNKKVVEDRNPENIARRKLIEEDAETRAEAIAKLRQRAREEYLAKRSEQQVEIERALIAEEERENRGKRLTRREQEQLEKRKQAIRHADELKALEKGDDAYAMPDDYFNTQGKLDSRKKEAALYQRCKYAHLALRRLHADTLLFFFNRRGFT